MVNPLNKVLGREYVPLNLAKISSKNLASNYKYLSSLNKNLKIAPVLKSNAYGHGIVKVAKIADKLGAPMLCVDSLFEAYLLKKANIKTPILIMGYIHPTSLKVKKLPFAFTVFSKEQLEVIDKYQKNAQIHIKVDTGMHRLGIPMQDLPEFIEDLRNYKNVKVAGLMSHIAYQESLGEKLTVHQLTNFQKARSLLAKEGFTPEWYHISASGPALLNPAKIAKISNLARAGLAFYGIDSTGRHPKLKPALKLTTKIVQIKKLKKGEKVGYSGTFVAPREMKTGILPLGYNDGVDRNLSNKGTVLVAGKKCNIVGNVSMNITTIDLSPARAARLYQEVTVFSDNPKDENSIANAAQICGRIPYEFLVNLSESSLKREVV